MILKWHDKKKNNSHLHPTLAEVYEKLPLNKFSQLELEGRKHVLLNEKTYKWKEIHTGFKQTSSWTISTLDQIDLEAVKLLSVKDPFKNTHQSCSLPVSWRPHLSEVKNNLIFPKHHHSVRSTTQTFCTCMQTSTHKCTDTYNYVKILNIPITFTKFITFLKHLVWHTIWRVGNVLTTLSHTTAFLCSFI